MSEETPIDAPPAGEICDLFLTMPGAACLEGGAFQGEEEYWELASGRLLARLHLRIAADAIPRTLLAGAPGCDIGQIVDARKELEDREGILAAALRRRARETPPNPGAPRLIRLAARLSLDEREKDVLDYLVFFGSDPRVNARRHAEAADIGSFFELPPADFLALLESGNRLVSSGLIEVDRNISLGHQASEIRMSLPVVRALRGLPLSSLDRVALGETALVELLAEETPGTEHPNLPPGLPETAASPGIPGPEGALEPAAAAPREPPIPLPAEPYKSDFEYLNEHFEWLRALHKWRAIVSNGDSPLAELRGEQPSPARLRELALRERVLRAGLERRVRATRESGLPLPRLERLAAQRGLDQFEKNVLVLLVGIAASPQLREALGVRIHVDVGDMLRLFCEELEDQVARRRHFYRTAPLLRDGLIQIQSPAIGSDLLYMDLWVDRRMADYILGLEDESAELTEGSHLFTPEVDLERVLISESDKRLILRTVESYPAFREARRRTGLDELVRYGAGLVLLFHGPSGTGKTMMANALATRLGKRLLLVNYPRIGKMSSDEALQFLFREAKIHDAILFFDECESIFGDRHFNSEMSLILSEIERHDGLVILATTQPELIDEAMHRRITLAVEFRNPDPRQREMIWQAHIPPRMPLEGKPDLAALAGRYELTGGLIKNAVLTALAIATSRDPSNPIVRAEDLEQGARLQMRSRLAMADFEDRVVPSCGLSSVVLPPDLHRSLEDLVGLEKARGTLISDWGFENEGDRAFGVTALLYGPPGTGKSLSAEAIAWELGRPLKRINAARVVSKWVGETSKNLEAIFKEARHHEAVLLFDEADALFAGRTSVASATDRYANLDVAVLLREMERFPGVVILTSNLSGNIDEAFRRRLRFILEFAPPDAPARLALWKRHLPAKAPLAPDVCLERLAAYELTGAQIRNAVVKAASRAALRPADQRLLAQADLARAAREEARSAGGSKVVGFRCDVFPEEKERVC